MEEDEDIFAYTRILDGKRLFVLGNFHGAERTVTLPDAVKNVLLANYQKPQIDGLQVTLRPYEAFMAEL